MLHLDFTLFHWINQVAQHPVLDMILPLFRNKLVWIPLYLFIAGFVLINFGKRGFYYLLFGALTVGIADVSSSHWIKPWVKRERPCRQLDRDQVRTMVHCGGGYSFPSSHATNHFALAVFLILTFGRRHRWVWLALVWAAIISYAQIYVGVHFPLDILGGALLGTVIGRIISWTYSRLDDLHIKYLF